jgi:hypothetical protein
MDSRKLVGGQCGDNRDGPATTRSESCRARLSKKTDTESTSRVRKIMDLVDYNDAIRSKGRQSDNPSDVEEREGTGAELIDECRKSHNFNVAQGRVYGAIRKADRALDGVLPCLLQR